VPPSSEVARAHRRFIGGPLDHQACAEVRADPVEERAEPTGPAADVEKRRELRLPALVEEFLRNHSARLGE
jgi:hypothetical protein